MRSAEERAKSAEGLRRTAMSERFIAEAPSVAAYLALPGEPDLGLLIASLRDGGCHVALPRLADGGGLTFAEFTGELAPGPPTSSGLQIPEPTGPAVNLADIDVLLLPALAVDLEGIRLGQGGGYYDRTDLAGPVSVAVVHDDEFTDLSLPRESHDTVVKAVLTPTRLIWLPPHLTQPSAPTRH